MLHSARDVVARIARYNAGREPERLALKYRAMRDSVFSFFRGTAHLFWEDARDQRDSIPDAPHVWACGDLHLENFGSYRGANGLSYFDLNDFDEAALAPATWELARVVTSIYVAAPSLTLDRSDATELATSFLSSYQAALADGKALWIERATATGMVRTLLRRVERRTLATLLASRTTWRDGQRALRVDGRHALPLPDAEREHLLAVFARLLKTHFDGRRLKLMDIGRRIAGTGSLGIRRYVLLVRDDDVPEKYILLDAKEACPSTLARFAAIRQRTWETEADRVVRLQYRMQAVTPALLQAVKIGGTPYILRELQPTEDRLSLAAACDRPHHLRGAMRAMARTTAWAQLRSSGREGSATADDLIKLSRSRAWRLAMINYARRYQHTVERDWRGFVAAHEDGLLDPRPHADATKAR
jgi:uncharacterized protein (DUF2252 family)